MRVLRLANVPKHLIIAASSWLSKIIIASVQLVSIKFLLEILGEESYAIFTLLTGLLIWFSIADIGVGSSLQNYISELRVKNESYDSYIKAAIHILFASLIIFSGTLFLLSGKVSSLYLSSFSYEMKNGLATPFFIASVIFITVGIGNVVYKILFAEQLGWKANAINAASYMLGLLGVFLIRYLNLNANITTSLIALYAPVALLPILYTLYRYIKIIKIDVSLDNYKSLLSRSTGFLMFSFLSILVLQADYIVISQKLSATDIVKYTVTMKIFGLVFFIYTAVLQALWPLCAELRVKMQWEKLNKLVFINVFGGVLFISCSTLFIFIFKSYIYSIIAKNIDYRISGMAFVLLAVYFSLRVWCDTFAMLLQSMNQLRILWFIVPCQALIGGAAQWILAGSYGIVGILWGLIISFALTVFWGLPVYYIYKIKGLA
ncbi:MULTISPECIES: MATE family efflux transporter [unclassified Citrobacter]|uniref:MATE family efflux transporter n=1 Tax=unclassified Citrobacter TaxID=2644389 RepID=UPI0005F0B26A|nr:MULTISPECIES: MATE family efflux transporter [unclassified Citrobacter]MDM2941658.1 MATE family efflux transporter [Citrobacter sp. Cm038]